MGQAKAPLIPYQLQAVPERWTSKELFGRSTVSPPMLRNHVLNGRREGVRSLSETGWASANAVSMQPPSYDACLSLLLQYLQTVALRASR